MWLRQYLLQTNIEVLFSLLVIINCNNFQIIQHTAPPLTVIQELEKSITFFSTYGPPEALERAVKELGEVYEKNSKKRRIEEVNWNIECVLYF